MYYEETIINGVLCFRNTPKGEWIKFSDIELTNEILRLKEKLKELGKTNTNEQKAISI